MIKFYPTITVSENKQGGFTLIEIILTLVIAAVVGAGLVQYMGSAFVKSSIPIQRLRQAYELQQVMENITADYYKSVKNKNDLDDLSDDIGPKNSIQDNVYGKYIVVENKFIKFTPSQFEDPSEVDSSKKNLLKITIKKDSGEILTTLFSTQ